MDVFAVVDRLFLFCRVVVCTVCPLQAYFIVKISRLSVTHNIFLHFYFLVTDQILEENSFLPFFVYSYSR